MIKKVSNSRNRLIELMEHYHINQTELCRRTGLQKSALSNYINGDREPRQAQISLIADPFNINPAWLMGYDVPMEMPTPKVELDSQIAEAMKMYNEYIKASPEIQGMIESLLKLSQSIPSVQTPDLPMLNELKHQKSTSDIPFLKKDSDK